MNGHKLLYLKLCLWWKLYFLYGWQNYLWEFFFFSLNFLINVDLCGYKSDIIITLANLMDKMIIIQMLFDLSSGWGNCILPTLLIVCIWKNPGCWILISHPVREILLFLNDAAIFSGIRAPPHYEWLRTLSQVGCKYLHLKCGVL